VVNTTSSSDSYSEDLSVLRPDLSALRLSDANVSEQESATAELYTDEDFSIKSELDSVNKIIIRRNQEKRYTDGFTIQIYTGNSDESARAAKDSAEVKFPDLRPVISYNQPTFKVKVGAYYNRLDAHQVFEALKEEFPYALLIPERIPIRYE
jgi:hypothetical protein